MEEYGDSVEGYDDTLWTIKERGVDMFYITFMPFYNVIKSYVDKMEKEKQNDDKESYNEDYKKLEDLLSFLFNSRTFYLGADWEARAVLRWLDKYNEMKAVYAAGDELYLVVSC